MMTGIHKEIGGIIGAILILSIPSARSMPTAGEMIQAIRESEAEQTRTDPEDSINRSLAEFEHGSDDTPKQEVLLQLPSDGDQPSTGRRYDRCHHRSWIRFIQERTGKNCRSGYTREEDS